MSEDPEQFLSEFQSHLTLMDVPLRSPKAIAALHLQLRGPSLVWFNSLGPEMRNWDSIKAAFIAEYTVAPVLMAEEAAYPSKKLQPGQMLEELPNGPNCRYCTQVSHNVGQFVVGRLYTSWDKVAIGLAQCTAV